MERERERERHEFVGMSCNVKGVQLHKASRNFKQQLLGEPLVNPGKLL